MIATTGRRPSTLPPIMTHAYSFSTMGPGTTSTRTSPSFTFVQCGLSTSETKCSGFNYLSILFSTLNSKVENPNKNSPVTWYVPDIKEVDFVFGSNKTVIENTMKRLRKNGVSATIGIDGKTYWTARPTCNERANVYYTTGLRTNDDGKDSKNPAPYKDHTDYYTHCMAQVDLR